jgi:hypothetical protein
MSRRDIVRLTLRRAAAGADNRLLRDAQELMFLVVFRYFIFLLLLCLPLFYSRGNGKCLSKL